MINIVWITYDNFVKVADELNGDKDNHSEETDKSIEETSIEQGPESNPRKEVPEKSMGDSDHSDL